ncbi:hypothetical protein OG711_21835 [Streptomyces uncialis]|uniref:hypothetical protein n=1 Tax=Streptomyces uncialis TaxID=1048205 RepID=UPI002E33AFCC|nr:hypothetical protein [Streptomyces uncialis]
MTVDLGSLTSAERTVALYVSGMPNQRRRCTPEQLAAWLVQGVERLGMNEMRRWARFYSGHRALEVARVMPSAVQARHEQRFPNGRRLEWASQMSANSLWRFEMSAETLVRNRRDIEVDGECPCGGTATIDFPDCDPDFSFGLVCPVHGAATIAAHQGRIY